MPLGYRITVVIEVVKRKKKKEKKKKKKKSIFFQKKYGKPRWAATIGIWDMGDHTSKKTLKKGKVCPGVTQKKKHFSKKNFFWKKQKLRKNFFGRGPEKKILQNNFFLKKNKKLEKKVFFKNFLR